MNNGSSADSIATKYVVYKFPKNTAQSWLGYHLVVVGPFTEIKIWLPGLRNEQNPVFRMLVIGTESMAYMSKNLQLEMAFTRYYVCKHDFCSIQSKNVTYFTKLVHFLSFL